MYTNDTIDKITDFLFLENEIVPCQYAIVLGNELMETMVLVADLFNKGYIKERIIITGHSVKKDRKPEAERFFEYGLSLGIPEHMMSLEKEATNTYENLLFSKRIIEGKNAEFKGINSLMFVAKAFVMRRIWMTSRALNYPKDINYVFFPTVDTEGRNIGRDTWWKSEIAIERVLAELQRIATYSLKGDLSIF